MDHQGIVVVFVLTVTFPLLSCCSNSITQCPQRRFGAHIRSRVIKRRTRRRILEHLHQSILSPLPHLGPVVYGQSQQPSRRPSRPNLSVRQIPRCGILADQERFKTSNRGSEERGFDFGERECGCETGENLGEFRAKNRFGDIRAGDVE